MDHSRVAALLEPMRIHGQRHGDVAVAELAAIGCNIAARRDHQARRAVAQIMHLHATQLRPAQGGIENAAAKIELIHRRAVAIREA